MTPMDIKREFASWGPVREHMDREWARLFGGTPAPLWQQQCQQPPAPVRGGAR